MLDGLGALVGGRVRLWRYDGRACGSPPGPTRAGRSTCRATAGLVPTPGGTVWLEPVRESRASGSRSPAGRERALRGGGRAVLPLVGALLDAERQRAFLAEELASRYEEIDLLYAISEILGQTVQLEEATQTIVARGERRGRRAPRVDHGVRRGRPASLRTVAARGFAVDGLDAGAGGRRLLGRGAGLPRAARRRARSRDPGRRSPPTAASRAATAGRRSSACRSAMARPARRSAASASSTSPTGSAATASRRATASWSPRWPTRSAPRSRTPGWWSATAQQQRLRDELELAHDLQLKLLPSPAVLQGDAEVAARCLSGRLGRRRLLHLHPAGPRPGRRHAGRRVLARLLGRAGDGAGDVGRRHPRGRVGHAGRDAERAARQPGHRAGRDRDVLQRVLRRARPARRPAGLRQRRPPVRLPGAALRRAGAARGHRAAAGARHAGQHPAPPGALVGRTTICCALDRRAGGRAERGGRAVRRAAAARRGAARGAPSSPEAIVDGGARARPRRSARSRSTTARCSSSGSDGAPRQAPAGPAFPHRSPDPRPHRRRARGRRRTTRCSRSAPGPAGSPRARRASGPAGRHREGPRAGAGAAAAFPDATIVEGDALEVDWHALAGPRFLVAGNIPYNITSPLIDKALSRRGPPRIVFLVQKEVADRVTRRAGEPSLRRAQRGRPGGGAGGAAVHRAGRRVPPAAQGGFGGAPADAARRRRWSADRRRAASGGWWSGCSASGGSSCCAGSASSPAGTRTRWWRAARGRRASSRTVRPGGADAGGVRRAAPRAR